jgi:anti-sigma regulatory factor (Ser/Thr protein kinase)
MTGATVRESVKVAGLAERTRIVRSFVGAVLGPGHPCGDDAVLLVSELFANSLQHSGSGVPGETVTVTVTSRVGAVRVEVADLGGPGVPELRQADRDAEDGRGLGLVARLAARWGWRRRGRQMVTWFEIQALSQPAGTVGDRLAPDLLRAVSPGSASGG